MRVDLDHVGHRYADGPLLFHDLTASLMPGHVYALTGPSGAGKSTLLGIIAGWTTPAEGQVTRQGIDSMRWIFQNPHGVAQRTAIDHVSLPLLAKGLPRREAEEQARTLMDRFNLTRVTDRRFAELSGGEAQRLMLARASRPSPRSCSWTSPPPSSTCTLRPRSANPSPVSPATTRSSWSPPTTRTRATRAPTSSI